MSEQFFNYKAREDYNLKGKKNKTKLHQKFVDLCKLSQADLKEELITWGNKWYSGVDERGIGICGNGYLYIRGNIPVVLTAHMDTVHKELVKDFYEYKNNIISSPQGIGGDDRCGIYMIQQIVETTNLRPYIIFCEDEEIGGVGSNKFIKTHYFNELKDILFYIELDRANAEDLVFYDDDNEEFHKWCAEVTGYKEAYGSFSDISHFCPESKISGVNISCGYYNAHTTSEYVVMSEMENSIKATIKLIEKGVEENKQFEYVDTFRSWNCNDYYNQYVFGCNTTASNYNGIEGKTWVFYANEYQDEYTAEAESFEEAVGILLMSNPELCWAEIEDYYCM